MKQLDKKLEKKALKFISETCKKRVSGCGACDGHGSVTDYVISCPKCNHNIYYYWNPISPLYVLCQGVHCEKCGYTLFDRKIELPDDPNYLI